MNLNRIAHATVALLAVLLAAMACPFAAAGGRTAPGSTGWVYWTHDQTGFINDSIRKAPLDGSSGVQTIVSVPPPFTPAAAHGIAECTGIAVDTEHGKVYWTTVEWDDGKLPSPYTVYVRRANTDGSQVETLVARPDHVYVDIMLDPVGGRMYWIRNTAPSGQVYSANMNDGSDLQIIVPSINTPTCLAIDLPTRKLYWGLSPNVQCSMPGKIQRANLDGTGIEDVPMQTTMGPVIIGLAVDTKLGLIFWREGCPGNVKIRRAALDGTGVMDLPLGLVAPTSLALDVPNGRLYWGNQGTATGSIRRCDFNGQNVETVVPLMPAIPVRIALSLPTPSNPFDLNGDGHVNGIDLALLLGQWTGSTIYASCPPNHPADVNQDCKVNGLDLALLLGAWG